MKMITLFRQIALIAGLAFAVGLQGQYLVDFEGPNETKTAYASGEVVLSGLEWNMTEALIGTLDADFKNGERSARLRGYAASSMTMLQSKPNGLGEISFYYRRYGTDAQVDWKVEYSTNEGGTWTQAGSDFTAAASDEVQQFIASVGVDGNVRVRIKRATEEGAANRRLNIDDILLTDFGGMPTTATPVFDPPAGVFFQPIAVEIASATPDADIYYTTNGADPDQSSQQYLGPIQLTANTTLKARAYAPDHNPSLIATAVYTFPQAATTTLPYSESFEDDLGDCYVHSVSGDTKTWFWNSNEWAQINGHNSGDLEIDWLILPGIDFTKYINVTMRFDTWWRYGEDDDDNYLKLFYSHDYPGVGNPTDFTWTELNFTRPASDQTWASSGTIDLSGVSGSLVFIGFKYRYEPGKYRLWQVDDIEIDGDPVGVGESYQQALKLWPNPTSNTLNIYLEADAKLIIADHTGRFVLEQNLPAGNKNLSVGHLPSGVYTVHIQSQTGNIRTAKLLIK